MAIIEATATVLTDGVHSAEPKIHIDEATLGETYENKYRRQLVMTTEVLEDDRIVQTFPISDNRFERQGEDINFQLGNIPVVKKFQWMAPPFPLYRRKEVHLFWTPDSETVLDPQALLAVDDTLIHEPNPVEEELIYDLSGWLAPLSWKNSNITHGLNV